MPEPVPMPAPDFDNAQLADLAAVLPAENVRDLARSFRDMVAILLGALDAADGNVAALREQAHDLKGTSGSFGALRLSQLAEGLELASTRGEIVDLPPLLAEMQASATAAFAALDKALEGLG